MKGDTLSIFLCAIGLIPLNKLLAEIERVTQVWHIVDSSAGDKFDRMSKWLKNLKEIDPGFRYFPKPEKSLLINSEDNLRTGEEVKKKLDLK